MVVVAGRGFCHGLAKCTTVGSVPELVGIGSWLEQDGEEEEEDGIVMVVPVVLDPTDPLFWVLVVVTVAVSYASSSFSSSFRVTTNPDPSEC